MNPLIRFMRHSLTNILTATDDADQVDIEKIDETLTPNMRALRLVMNMSDHLLSMGTPANSVVHMALGVTDTYCKRKVHIDVSFNQITLSQDRGIDREPLTSAVARRVGRVGVGGGVRGGGLFGRWRAGLVSECAAPRVR